MCRFFVVWYYINYRPKGKKKGMVVEMMYRQDIENEVIDYIRNSGERVVDYDVDAIVDCLVVMYEREGVEFYRYCFEVVVPMNRVTE